MSTSSPVVSGLKVHSTLDRQTFIVGADVPLRHALVAAIPVWGLGWLLAWLGYPALSTVLYLSAVGIFGFWMAIRAMSPAIRIQLTPHALTVQQRTFALSRIKAVEITSLENFAHLYITTPQGRQFITSHRNKEAMRALTETLNREIFRSQHALGSPADVPEELRAIRGAARGTRPVPQGK